MLPKSKRLTKEDFSSTRPKIVFRGELFDIATINLTSQKFACVISKKTLKKAVERNLIKRRVSNIIKESTVLGKSSLLIYPKKISITTPYQQFKKALQEVFDTLH